MAWGLTSVTDSLHFVQGDLVNWAVATGAAGPRDIGQRGGRRHVRAALQRRGIAVYRILTTRSLARPGRWVDPDTGENGDTIADTDSPVTTLATVEGRVIRTSPQTSCTSSPPPTPHRSSPVDHEDFARLVATTARELGQAITTNTEPSPAAGQPGSGRGQQPHRAA